MFITHDLGFTQNNLWFPGGSQKRTLSIHSTNILISLNSAMYYIRSRQGTSSNKIKFPYSHIFPSLLERQFQQYIIRTWENGSNGNIETIHGNPKQHGSKFVLFQVSMSFLRMKYLTSILKEQQKLVKQTKGDLQL